MDVGLVYSRDIIYITLSSRRVCRVFITPAASGIPLIWVLAASTSSEDYRKRLWGMNNEPSI
jgi:hypothetical protein